VLLLERGGHFPGGALAGAGPEHHAHAVADGLDLLVRLVERRRVDEVLSSGAEGLYVVRCA
jgi:hypothetical protein